jgi:type IV secretory pathway VirB10-like protein
MRFGVTLIGALLLAGGIVIGQARPDLYSLERKLQDAQVALDNSVPTSADQREFRDLQDDVAYLRVKTRRGETVSERERRDVSDNIDRFINRLNRNAESTTRNEPPPRPSARPRDAGSGRYDRTIPAGTELDVRLETRLYSDTAQVEDQVEATTAVDLHQGDELLVPAGSRLTGHVTSVNRASRTDRKGSLTVEFNRLMVNGRTTDVRATVIEALESGGIKDEVGRVGAGAGVGAIIGGILGGMKGAIAGILIGAGGVLVATEGKDVDLPPGTMLRVRLDTPVYLTDH